MTILWTRVGRHLSSVQGTPAVQDRLLQALSPLPPTGAGTPRLTTLDRATGSSKGPPMGQKQRARAIVDAEYEMSTTSALGASEVIEAATRAAEASKGLLGVGVRLDQDHGQDDGVHVAWFSARGPGGLVPTMEFTVGAQEQGGATAVVLEVHEYIFQKGSLGMKPTISAKGPMTRFLRHFRTALSAAPAVTSASDPAEGAAREVVPIPPRVRSAPAPTPVVAQTASRCRSCGQSHEGTPFCTACGARTAPEEQANAG